MKELNQLYRKILNEGEKVIDRTQVGTLAIFGEQIKFNLLDGFPAVTAKKLAWKSVVSELLWFLKGSTNVNELRALLHGEEHRFNLDKKTIWDANYDVQGKALGYTDGELGPVYGGQWRSRRDMIVTDSYQPEEIELELELMGYNKIGYDSFDSKDFYERRIDQVKNLLDRASTNPECRRMIVSAWNPAEQHLMTLPPCHYGFQIRITGDYIDLLWTQRSVDSFLGLPFNIASYGVLLAIFGRILKKTPRYLTGQLGDTHIYLNHTEQVLEQLSREPLPAPKLWIHPSLRTLEDFENASVSDFELEGYESHAAIKAPMAV
ncbi:Thymidylate synthase [compost metagenome]